MRAKEVMACFKISLAARNNDVDQFSSPLRRLVAHFCHEILPVCQAFVK
jgi:hypothetical protein